MASGRAATPSPSNGREQERVAALVAGWLEPCDQAAAEAVLKLYAPLGAPSIGDLQGVLEQTTLLAAHCIRLLQQCARQLHQHRVSCR